MIISELIDSAAAGLSALSDTPRLDAEIIMSSILQSSRFALFIDYGKEISQSDAKRFQNLIDRRKKGVPVAYITGKKEFFEDVFTVDERVLVPRPETELLVEEAVKLLNLKQGPFNILDICAGSGCIGISVMKFAECYLTLADISPYALDVARKNAMDILPDKSGSISFVQSDLFSGISDTFDMITANPPYLSVADMENIKGMPPSHEPELALKGGETGFEFSFNLLEQVPYYLKPGGYFLMEIGIGGYEYAKRTFPSLELIKTIKDYSKIERICIWQKI